MGKKIIDRTGEESYNNFGSKIIIIKYNNYDNIDIYFPQYDWTYKNSNYEVFKKGNIKCPYEPRVYGIGYVGEGKYDIIKNKKYYKTWQSMLQRCYDKNFHKKESTYKNCKVCEEWHNFQNFAEWYEENFYQINNETMCLDKDILIKSNKIYSPNTCVFVPKRINSLFVKSDNIRGILPIGVSYCKLKNKFRATCNIYDFKNKKSKTKHIGYYNTSQEAFYHYKKFKENYIKEVADLYKNKIPKKLYDAMYKYEIRIDD